jgi:hypothetical protein
MASSPEILQDLRDAYAAGEAHAGIGYAVIVTMGGLGVVPQAQDAAQ